MSTEWVPPLSSRGSPRREAREAAGSIRRKDSEPLAESRSEHDVDHIGNGVCPSPVPL
jgi:hypothetical protein